MVQSYAPSRCLSMKALVFGKLRQPRHVSGVVTAHSCRACGVALFVRVFVHSVHPHAAHRASSFERNHSQALERRRNALKQLAGHGRHVQALALRCSRRQRGRSVGAGA